MPDLDSFIKELLDRKKVDNYILELSERVTSEIALKELLLLARETDQLAKVLSTKNSKQVDISCGEILQQVFLASTKDYLHNPGRRFIKALSIEATRRIQLAGNKQALEEEFSEAPTTPKDLNKTPWSFGEGQEIYRCPSCLSIKITKKDLGFRCPQCLEKLPADLEPSYREKENAFGRQRPRTSAEVSARKEATPPARRILRCSSCGSQRTKMDPANAGKLLCAKCGSDKLEHNLNQNRIDRPRTKTPSSAPHELPDKFEINTTAIIVATTIAGIFSWLTISNSKHAFFVEISNLEKAYSYQEAKKNAAQAAAMSDARHCQELLSQASIVFQSRDIFGGPSTVFVIRAGHIYAIRPYFEEYEYRHNPRLASIRRTRSLLSPTQGGCKIIDTHDRGRFVDTPRYAASTISPNGEPLGDRFAFGFDPIKCQYGTRKPQECQLVGFTKDSADGNLVKLYYNAVFAAPNRQHSVCRYFQSNIDFKGEGMEQCSNLIRVRPPDKFSDS